MPAGNSRENEIKLRIESAAAGLSALQTAGFTISAARVFETNTVYDTPDLSFREHGSLVRLRRAGTGAVLTFKGPAAPGPHKNREEIETELSDAGAMAAILERLGLEPVFRYEKYRTELRAPDGRGVATVDETPIGFFLELEGAPEWIDRTAEALGYSQSDYITASYAALYFRWCAETGVTPSDMAFTRAPQAPGQ